MFLNLLRSPYRRRLEKPVVIQFPVIDICNSKCQMCKIWERKGNDAMSLEDIRAGFSSPLFSEVRAVGINGGEPTLRKDLAQIVDTLFDCLPKLKHISLITNGYNAPIVIQRIKEIAEVVERRGGGLDVMVSLDGVGEVHDRVRGKSGNFERAVEVLRFAKGHSGVQNVRVGCTVIKENVYGLHDLFDFCQKEGVYVKYRIGIPHKRLYSEEVTGPFKLDDDEIVHIAEFLKGLCRHYETSPLQRYFYRSLVDQLLHHAPRRSGCDWQHRGATVTARGELLYCAVKSPTIGNFVSGVSEKDYFASEPLLEGIRSNECANCLHDYVGLPDLKGTLGILLEKFVAKVKRKFPMLWRLPRAAWIKGAGRHIVYRIHRHRFRAYIRPDHGVRIQPGRVLIIGWYGTETLGDKGILGGVLDELRAGSSRGPLHIDLMSYNPYLSRMTVRQLKAQDVHVVSVDEALKNLGRYERVIFGGGPIMAIREIVDMAEIFRAARRLGAKNVIAGCGVGPLGHSYLNSACVDVLKEAHQRVYRDQESLALARHLGVSDSRDRAMVDPAFNWLRQFAGTRGGARGTKTIALGLRDFPYVQYAYELGPDKGKALGEKIARQLEELILGLVKSGYRILPIPMCTNSFGDDDRFFYRRIFQSFDDLVVSQIDFEFLNEELDPERYVAGFLRSDLVVAMRFHSLVFALGCERPVVALDYTLGKGKVGNLAKRFGVPSFNLESMEVTDLLQGIQDELSAARKKSLDGVEFRLEEIG